MDKTVKGIAITAAAMVAIGLLLAGVGYAAGGNQPISIDKSGVHVGEGWGNGNKGAGHLASSGKLESFEEELDHFDSIRTDMNLYPVELIAGDKYAIEGVYDTGYGKPEYTIENGTLVVEERNDSFFSKGIDLSIQIGGSGSESERGSKIGVKIYYPKDSELKDVRIKAAMADMSFDGINADTAEFDNGLGRLELSNISANKIKAFVGSGDCTVSDVKADALDVTNNLGKTTLKNVEVRILEAKSQSGDLFLSGITAEQGMLKLNLGKLTAENLNTKGLTVENQSGDVDLGGTLLGDTDITSNLGKVSVSLGATESQYNYDLKTNLGEVMVGDNESSSSMQAKNGAKNNLKVFASLGDIEVEFE
ncbi:MAG: hypothetical protein K0Q48_1258 [Bacillota bacterium]|nr:hypothetical protein [Bacillota bacterium]